MTLTPKHDSDYVLIVPECSYRGLGVRRFPKNVDVPDGWRRIEKFLSFNVADHSGFLHPRYWSIPLYEGNPTQENTDVTELERSEHTKGTSGGDGRRRPRPQGE